jgi:hypothetical protein
LKTYILSTLFAAIFTLNAIGSENPDYRDLYSDTWVATDAIGRTMPDISLAGPVKNDRPRTVGIFYITWHGDNMANINKPFRSDVTKILAADPNARLDAKHPLWIDKESTMYHWGEPEVGYFLSKDEYVIAKDLSMFADAGIDVLILDVTNAVHYWEEWDVLFSVAQKMKNQGNKVPKFCFWAFNGQVITVVQSLYDNIYKTGKYKDFWFYWNGKPLLLYNDNPAIDAAGGGARNSNPHYDPAAKTDPNHPHYGDPDYAEEFYKDYTKEVKNFFTTRMMWWGYYEWAGKRFVGIEDKWSFGYALENEHVHAMNPDDLASTHKGVKEEVAVTPAEHPIFLVGKSWSRKHGEPELNQYDLPVKAYVPRLGKLVEHPEHYGIHFQERWDEAIKTDPQFIYINDWNEWTAGKYNPGQLGTDPCTPFPFLRRQNPFIFVDQYNAEFNRGIQPMKGGYTDNYYMQMAQNIRKYKGVRPIPTLSGLHTIAIDGKFDDWCCVKVEYRDTIGDTIHRDYPGYSGLHYKNSSGRNDIAACKVAVDANTLYFYAETNQSLTPHTDSNWMLLLIDADKNANTGWYGYDYLINKNIVDANATTLMRYSESDKQWVKKTQLQFRYAGKSLEVAVPRETLGLKGDAAAFDFHWCDNPAELKDPISLCTDGDSAPNRRFNYRCIWTSNSKE